MEIPSHPTDHPIATPKVSDLEWRTLMVGAVAPDTSSDGNGGGGGSGSGGDGGVSRPKPVNLPWLSGKAWDQLLAYEATLGPAFSGLPTAVASSADAWKVMESEPNWFILFGVLDCCLASCSAC